MLQQQACPPQALLHLIDFKGIFTKRGAGGAGGLRGIPENQTGRERLFAARLLIIALIRLDFWSMKIQ
jgi:hypothetical protein